MRRRFTAEDGSGWRLCLQDDRPHDGVPYHHRSCEALPDCTNGYGPRMQADTQPPEICREAPCAETGFPQPPLQLESRQRGVLSMVLLSHRRAKNRQNMVAHNRLQAAPILLHRIPGQGVEHMHLTVAPLRFLRLRLGQGLGQSAAEHRDHFPLSGGGAGAVW